MIKFTLAVAILLAAMPTALWPRAGAAKAPSADWSPPYRLSAAAATASEGYMAVDAYGYVHCFWTEVLPDQPGTSIQYSRFDGATWSTPIAIYVAAGSINNVSPAVDQLGTLYIGWTEGLNGPAYFASAPASQALSARDWSRPIRVDLRANHLLLRVDTRTFLHAMYINRDTEAGVYYVRSEDRGETWSEPVWLDPDILPDHIPDSLNFEVDQNDGLHAVWFYGALGRGSRPDWVRYSHSLDGGQSWSDPFLIDKYTPENEHNLSNASPRMVVEGVNVHVVWAAGELPYRYHRYSPDAGQNWSSPRRILGDLHGQAFDSLTVDGAGRVHFLGQIRYPIAIYHAYWEHDNWALPSPVYLISQDGSLTDLEGRVHAHDLTAVVRVGNQLVLTFADPPAEEHRRLFTMHNTLDDIQPIQSPPLPVLTATPNVLPNLLPSATAPQSTLSSETGTLVSVPPVPGSSTSTQPDLALRAALVPTLILLGVTVIWRVVRHLWLH